MPDAQIEIVSRSRLFETLEEIIEMHRRQSWEFAMLLVGINKFRQFNITHDFQAGDELLTEFYRRMRQVARDQDVVLRVGDSEFVMIISNLFNEGHAALAAIRLLGEFEEVFQIDGKQLRINASIGGAIYPDHGQVAPSLLKSTEMAMLEARRSVESYFIYTERDTLIDATAWDIGSELQTAIEQDQLELYFQPQVNLETGHVSGAEALLRWKHPLRGCVRPDLFIPVAEQTGVIHAITDWTIHAALWQAREWPDTPAPLNVSVNLSSRIFDHEGLVESIQDSARIFDTDLERLTLEVTESAFIDDMATAIRVLDDLKSLGVNISIDDFGTGYSSMSYFKRIPANELKVDRSFVTHMLENPMDLHIVRSITDMARGFGLKVVAEGIENRETFDMLKSVGCDIGQGNYVSDALPQDSFIDWLTRYGEVC